MDLDKILKFFAENLVDWSRVTYLTLVHPISRFEPVTTSEWNTQSLVDTFRSERQLWLSPRLLTFAVFSVIVGTTINGLLPNRIPGPQHFVVVAVVLSSWFFHASYLHLLCKMLRGSGSYLETLSVSVQVFATIYVVSSFLSLIAGTIVLMPYVSNTIKKVYFIGELIVSEPALLFFIILALLQSLYIPMSLRHVHKFGRFRVFAIFLISSLSVVVSLYISIPLYHRSGVMTNDMIMGR